MVCIKVRAPPLTIPMPIGAIAHDAAMHDPFGSGAVSASPIYEISYKFGVQWDEAEDRKQPVRRHCRGHRSQRLGCAEQAAYDPLLHPTEPRPCRKFRNPAKLTRTDRYRSGIAASRAIAPMGMGVVNGDAKTFVRIVPCRPDAASLYPTCGCALPTRSAAGSRAPRS